MSRKIEIEVEGGDAFTIEIYDAPAVAISTASDNRLETKPDGLYVKDRLDPDPVAYYLLAKG